MTVTWRLTHFNRVVQLSFSGQDGPQEIVSRHPNWGWVLFSQGTVWTSFEVRVSGAGAARVCFFLVRSPL